MISRQNLALDPSCIPSQEHLVLVGGRGVVRVPFVGLPEL